MRGGKQLLLLAVFVLLARCQQKPQVSMAPNLQQIFSGDIFYLSCDNSVSGSRVKWYFNNKQVEGRTNKTWTIAVANPKFNGNFCCESDGQKSDTFSVNVLDYAPSASLTIKTGQPVMQTGGSVVLQLDNEDSLQGWHCWDYRGKQQDMIKLRLEEDSVSVVFQPNRLDVSQTIFWCTDSRQQRRTNQITVRTSGKAVSLEMYPLPAVVGESLALRCLVWGTDQISRTVFYKDNAIILQSVSPTYEIPLVTESAKGKYKCNASFTYKARTGGTPYQVVSDDQDVYVQGPLMKAVVSENIGLSCSCPLCFNNASYRWYYKKDHGRPWTLMDSREEFIWPKASGTYACRAVWHNMRSFLSIGYVFSARTQIIQTAVVIVLIILSSAGVALCIWYRKRNRTEQMYEEVALSSRDKGDAKYEELQRPHGALLESEYTTLEPKLERAREKKECEYEPLKKDEMQEGVYQTLGMEGAVREEAGYEALKKSGMKEGVYHTLGAEGAAEGAEGH